MCLALPCEAERRGCSVHIFLSFLQADGLSWKSPGPGTHEKYLEHIDSWLKLCLAAFVPCALSGMLFFSDAAQSLLCNVLLLLL